MVVQARLSSILWQLSNTFPEIEKKPLLCGLWSMYLWLMPLLIDILQQTYVKFALRKKDYHLV